MCVHALCLDIHSIQRHSHATFVCISWVASVIVRQWIYVSWITLREITSFHPNLGESLDLTLICVQCVCLWRFDGVCILYVTTRFQHFSVGVLSGSLLWWQMCVFISAAVWWQAWWFLSGSPLKWCIFQVIWSWYIGRFPSFWCWRPFYPPIARHNIILAENISGFLWIYRIFKVNFCKNVRLFFCFIDMNFQTIRIQNDPKI